jgi:hypothetical protein
MKSFKSGRKHCASVAWECGGRCVRDQEDSTAQAGARIGFAELQHQERDISSHWAMRPFDATPVKQYSKDARRLCDDIWWQLRTLLRARDRGRRGEQVVPAEKAGPSRRP